ncbi:MAG: hypothetical protein M3Z92_07355 [Bacteroidota bacterium]|nr:hypothetical protein [Bacteroidota bacterium]
MNAIICTQKNKPIIMAETLGMLCDKLTIVKLKQYHTEDVVRLDSLNKQSLELQAEINLYLSDAINGNIPVNKLTFESNKVFKKEGNNIQEVTGNIAEVFYKLADVNCRLWHEQEKVYEFEKVPASEKDIVVKQLALLNLERNKCIDSINGQLAELIKQKNKEI